MSTYSLSHLSDHDLLRALRAMVARERTATIDLLPHIAEVDARRLFVPAGYDSMYAYCVHELRLSEDSALKRIRAARAARDFPAIFDALGDGRLHLGGVALMAKHLRPENAAELLAAAAHKTCKELELLIASRFPQPDLPARVQALSGGVLSCETQLATWPVERSCHPSVPGCDADPLAARPVAGSAPPARVKPLSPERFALQVTIAASTHDKLEYAKALLGHAVPSGDLAEVLDRALDALVAQLERQKFAATRRPHPARASTDSRHIPAYVKRTVWERDGGQCSFVSEAGQPCAARKRLEFDHVDPVACGGKATVEGIRLRCRAHNQFEAECVFGAGFMASKREAAEARRATAVKERQAAAEAKASAAAESRALAATEADPDRSVVPWLRRLGSRLQDARAAAAHVRETIPEGSMEEQIRVALRFLASRNGRAA